jgi:mono/diheme cytochrome c family protein
MRFPAALCGFVLPSCLLLVVAVAAAGADPAADKLARGKYLTEEVAKCQECHTPRLETGELDKERWLKGAVLNFGPLEPGKGKWHKTSPDLTATSSLWKRWQQAGMEKYLQTGLNPRGNPADPPMPAYKLTKDDAEAIVAYLQSLK